MTLVSLVLLGFALCALPGCEKSKPSQSEADEKLIEKLRERSRSRPKTTSMSLGYTHVLEEVDQGGPVAVETTDGGTFEIEGAWLVVSAIEAHLCEPELTMDRRLWDMVVPSAHAHVPSSATRLGVPFVEDLFSKGGKASIVGEVSPPAGQYCKLYAVVSPADADIMNLTGLSTSEVVGKSLLVRGRLRADDSSSWEQVELTSDARHVVEFDAVDPRTGESPLTLRKGGATQMLLLEKTVSPGLFEGLSAEQIDDGTAAETILERLENTFRVKQFDNSKDGP